MQVQGYSTGLLLQEFQPTPKFSLQTKLGCFPPFPAQHIFLPPLFSTLPLTHSLRIPPLPPLPLTHFPRTPPLPPLPLKDISWSLPDCLNLDAIDFLAFTYVIFGTEPAHRCLPFYFSYLVVMFLEKLVWRACLSGEGAFPQCGTEIMILHVREWAKSRSITFRTF